MTYRGSLPSKQQTSKSRTMSQQHVAGISHNVVVPSHTCDPSAWYVSLHHSSIELMPFPFANLRKADTPQGRPIKGLPESITVDSDAPASEIFRKIASVSKFSIHRLRVTKGSDGSAVPNAAGVTVHDTGLRNKSAVDVKDLGILNFYTACAEHH
jgi:hypothetical protein